MAAYKHKYVDMNKYVRQSPPKAPEYSGLTCVLNMGGGLRRPFYAEWVQDLGDPNGPMARHVVRATRRTQALAQAQDPGAPPEFDGGTRAVPMPLGDYVVYCQEIVETWTATEPA